MKSCTEYIDENVKCKKIPGVVCGVYDKDGKTIYEHIAGYLDPINKTPMRRDAIFRIASMTKPITGLATLKAEELGLLSIEDDITKYLPEYSEMYVGRVEDGKLIKDHKAKRIIKIKNLLSHSAGLGTGETNTIQASKYGRCVERNSTVKDYSKWLLEFDPGEKSLYSGMAGLDVLATIIELVSKTPYNDFIHKYILDPLEMKDTTFVISKDQQKRLARLCYIFDNGKDFEPFPDFDSGFDSFCHGYVGGAAGLYSTFSDYSNLCIMLVNNGVFKGKRLFTEESMKKYVTPILNPPVPGVDEFLNWGYTVLVRGGIGGCSLLPKGCFGWSGAYSTHFFIDPINKQFGLYMMNTSNILEGEERAIDRFEKEYAKHFFKGE